MSLHGPLDGIVAAAVAGGGVFARSLRDEPLDEPVWHELAGDAFAPGFEAIYEGYLLHYGRPRLFAPASQEDALLCGDFLYARGLTWISQLDDARAVAALAELIAIVSAARVDAPDADGFALWAATAIGLTERGDARYSAARRAFADGDGAAPLEALLAGRDVSRERAAHVRFGS